MTLVMGYATTRMALMISDGQGSIRSSIPGEKVKATLKIEGGPIINFQAKKINIANFRKIHILSEKYCMGGSGAAEFVNSITTLLSQKSRSHSMTFYQCSEFLDSYFTRQLYTQKLPTEPHDFLLSGFDEDKGKFGLFWLSVAPWGWYSIGRYNPKKCKLIPIFIGSGGLLATDIYCSRQVEFNKITQIQDIEEQIKSLIEISAEIIHEVSKKDDLVNDDCFYVYISKTTGYKIVTGTVERESKQLGHL